MVDDERDLAAIVVFLLQRAGYEAIEAYNAQNALDLLHKRRVDLVVTDVMMPGMTGVELANAIRLHERLAGLKILGMSAAPEGSLRCMDGPFDDFLPKPFRVKDFLERVSHLLGPAE